MDIMPSLESLVKRYDRLKLEEDWEALTVVPAMITGYHLFGAPELTKEIMMATLYMPLTARLIPEAIRGAVNGYRFLEEAYEEQFPDDGIKDCIEVAPDVYHVVDNREKNKENVCRLGAILGAGNQIAKPAFYSVLWMGKGIVCGGIVGLLSRF